ncbi:endoflagellar motor switch protein [Leptospira sp. 2 VSF19]|uniref:Endoflagellar motor switch protein n=1 Tax=Leptospira soteropolitanensis TaxID=2950025 RepID=A0AAW5VGA1_9LEPT|nr:FliG C-terminal domain-containing protein [Leptospira soteropolitanensis]MCW7491056.1 endoflagellar motor switch protein [Leptospira soteropolitanensis]MCW7498640.1 endoflagellar motor switch protein [Leptospira soteropolitanensis]MCW7521767.1 endoflagellar motor switch protein [Leptospira soteropolitanensis]MCW7524744.1 endoflagellar motor switch protein [Leptospira soteropolitanensis]MCW7528611.1 endoflagellar motor switch protein [Leptospira soteropolitanensis]
MKTPSGPNKAALAYQILGRYLPDEVFAHLSDAEIESLLIKVESNPSPTRGQEKDILLSFTNFLQKNKQKTKGKYPFETGLPGNLQSRPGTQKIGGYTNNGYPPNSPAGKYAKSGDFLEKAGKSELPIGNSPLKSGFSDRNDQHGDLNESSDGRYTNSEHPDSSELYSLIQEILKEEESKSQSPLWQELPRYSVEMLRHLTMDESSEVVARVLSFSDPETASEVLSEYPENHREDIILALSEVDYHSDRERDQLERFLRFKMELIEKKMPVSKIRSRKAKTAGEILTRLPFLPSQNLIERIQKKSPEYAETIVEHYFRLEDLLHLGRTSLTRFFSEIHPLVIACALKGVETDFRDQVYSNLESWLVKEIKIEWDSLGPVSLAEIEEAQKGILDRLREAMDEGKVKLWRLK